MIIINTDHVINHKVEGAYEKQLKLYLENARREYAKASKKINVFSTFESGVNGEYDVFLLNLEHDEALANQKRTEVENQLRGVTMERYDVLCGRSQQKNTIF